MDNNHLLNLNPQKTLRCLEGILAPPELDKIREAISANVEQLMRLGQAHLRFARMARGKQGWRQRVSRAYYACYSASRATRLGVHGHYDQEVGDHKKVGELPDDFPSRATWLDLLTKFRGDRNIADYDHTGSERSLELPSRAYVEKAAEFVLAARTYLQLKGHL